MSFITRLFKPRTKRSDGVDPEALEKKAKQSLAQTANNQAKVNYITKFLNERSEENGFGDDFAITFEPRGAR